jgi:hypothetical protein
MATTTAHTTNSTLLHERKKASFDVKKVTLAVCGGEEALKRRERLLGVLKSHPVRISELSKALFQFPGPTFLPKFFWVGTVSCLP